MAKRILNRKEMRADYDAAERRQQEEEQDKTEDEAEDETDEEEDEVADEAGGDEEEAEEEVKKPAKKKATPKAAKPKPRSRAAKVVRMKVVWRVFSNSNQKVADFDYPRRLEAEALAAKLTADKKSTHFVQPVKEPMEEKKE